MQGSSFIRALSGMLVAVLLTACAGATVEQLRDPVPEALVTSASVPGYTHIRYWGDDAQSISQSVYSEIAAQQLASGNTSVNRYYLSISGGGSNGAFGAGVLFGWTAAGTRPEFTIVTGISTGSLIAPFAFLGKPYDDRLKDAYTTISGKNIYRKKNIFGIIGSDSAADNTPLRKLVATYVTDQMLVESCARTTGAAGY